MIISTNYYFVHIRTLTPFPSKVNEWRPWMTHYCLIHAGDYGSLIDPDAVETITQQRYLSNIPTASVIQAMEELIHHAP